MNLPLIIDLDGTLLRSDLLLESGLAYLRLKPTCALLPIGWLFSGKAYLKQQLANNVQLDISNLPYDPNVIAFIKTEKAKGRKIILATASHKIYAEQIAEYLNLFDQVIATEGNRNLSAQTKRDVLIEEFGAQGFDYAGNSLDDIPVWSAARHAYLVNPEPGVENKIQRQRQTIHVIRTPKNSLYVWMRALRLHQWIKNLLIFIPLLASHQITNINLLWHGLLAFLFFGLCASGIYLWNDLLDMTDDRHHPSKRYRPLASGTLSIKSALLAIPLLLGIAFIGSVAWLPWQFTAILAIYFVLTIAYSFILKRLMVIDVIILALLYTLRIIAGAFAFELTLTFWMLAFSTFIFLSLALVKRYAELRTAKTQGKTEQARGRGYYPNDLEMIASMGSSAGYLSVLVLALYVQDHSTVALYQYPSIIWLACPLLLFWITRVWLITHRGQMHDDPIIFAIKDRASLLVCGLFGLIFWLAI